MHPVRVEPVPPTASARRTVGPAARALLKNPLALSQALVYHRRMRRFRLPQDALEGLAYLGEKVEGSPNVPPGPSIMEVELNPTFAYPDRAVPVDALVVRRT